MIPLTLFGEGTRAPASQDRGSSVGLIHELTGFDEVTAVNAGEYRNLKLRDPVYVGDKILTAKEQTVTIEFLESTLVMVGPDSTFVVAEYDQAPKQNTVLEVLNGIVRAIVKKKYSPDERFQIRTPAAAMGVRGTEFIVQVDGGSGDTKVHTLSGVVAFALNGGLLWDKSRSVEIKAGSMSMMTKKMFNPVSPAPYNAKDFQREMRRVSPQLNAPVSQYKIDHAPLPGVRPELERGAGLQEVRKSGVSPVHKSGVLGDRNSGGKGGDAIPVGAAVKNSISEKMRPARAFPRDRPIGSPVKPVHRNDVGNDRRHEPPNHQDRRNHEKSIPRTGENH